MLRRYLGQGVEQDEETEDGEDEDGGKLGQFRETEEEAGGENVRA